LSPSSLPPYLAHFSPSLSGNTTTWLKYADMEMKHKFINHARNVWDRAVTLHPRVDQLWYKYSYMEEMLGNITAGAYPDDLRT
jgi:hypothetical protein